MIKGFMEENQSHKQREDRIHILDKAENRQRKNIGRSTGTIRTAPATEIRGEVPVRPIMSMGRIITHGGTSELS